MSVREGENEGERGCVCVWRWRQRARGSASEGEIYDICRNREYCGGLTTIESQCGVRDRRGASLLLPSSSTTAAPLADVREVQPAEDDRMVRVIGGQSRSIRCTSRLQAAPAQPLRREQHDDNGNDRAGASSARRTLRHSARGRRFSLCQTPPERSVAEREAGRAFLVDDAQIGNAVNSRCRRNTERGYEDTKRESCARNDFQ